MATAWRWFVRLFALCAMALFAALMVIFVIVTVNHFGEKQYVTDNVKGLPPVFVITAILIPCCAAFVVGFWMLFYDSFKRPVPLDYPGTSAPVPLLAEGPSRRERLVTWARGLKPHRPEWLRR